MAPRVTKMKERRMRMPNMWGLGMKMTNRNLVMSNSCWRALWHHTGSVYYLLHLQLLHPEIEIITISQTLLMVAS